MTLHAKLRPPSAAHRWLSCPGSPEVLLGYDNPDSKASIKGTVAHDLLADAVTFGVTPNHPDIEIVQGVMMALEYVLPLYKQLREGKGGCELICEETIEIPETGEFGTLDIGLVTPSLIHVIDYKNGYVPVNIRMNPQLLLYLLGLIARYGERRNYKITVVQPNYVHADGMIRHQDVTEDDLTWFRQEVASALQSNAVVAGKHCRETYCPARGTCNVFLGWAQENLKLAYYPGESVAMTDEQLAQALDEADVLQGWRDQLRGEAMRRILHQNKQIAGYKIVKAKRDRAFKDEKARAAVYRNLQELGVPDDALYTKEPISPAGVEREVKRIFKPQGRSAWLKGMQHVCPPEALEPANQALTLEKAIDGRKPYTRGSEFPPIDGATPEDVLTAIDATNATNALKDVL